MSYRVWKVWGGAAGVRSNRRRWIRRERTWSGWFAPWAPGGSPPSGPGSISQIPCNGTCTARRTCRCPGWLLACSPGARKFKKKIKSLIDDPFKRGVNCNPAITNALVGEEGLLGLTVAALRDGILKAAGLGGWGDVVVQELSPLHEHEAKLWRRRVQAAVDQRAEHARVGQRISCHRSPWLLYPFDHIYKKIRSMIRLLNIHC